MPRNSSRRALKLARLSLSRRRQAHYASLAAGPHYRCVCSYPYGPHALHCLNANPDAAPPPAGLPAGW